MPFSSFLSFFNLEGIQLQHLHHIGRFAYRYTETTEYDKTPVDEPVTVSDLKLNQYKYSVILSIGKTTAIVCSLGATLGGQLLGFEP